MSRKPNKNKTKKNIQKSSNKTSISVNKEQANKKNNSIAAVVKSPKTNPKKKRGNPFKKLINFFKSSINEVKKIVWPTPKATFKNMAVVLVIVAIIGLFVFALDTGLLALLGKFMGIANS